MIYIKQLLVISLCLVCVYSQSSPETCFYTDSRGCYYNLTSLVVPVDAPAEDYYIFLVGNEYVQGEHFTNICESINPSTTECLGGESSCQENIYGEHISCGRTESGEFTDYDGTDGSGTCPGVLLTYLGGDTCELTDMLIETQIFLLCDYNQTEPLVVEVATGAGGCLYEVYIKTIEACGTGVSATPTRSFGSTLSPSATTTLSPIPIPSASPPETSDSYWLWIVLGLVVVVIVICVLVAIGGFIFYKKSKMNQYNSMLDE